MKYREEDRRRRREDEDSPPDEGDEVEIPDQEVVIPEAEATWEISKMDRDPDLPSDSDRKPSVFLPKRKFLNDRYQIMRK